MSESKPPDWAKRVKENAQQSAQKASDEPDDQTAAAVRRDKLEQRQALTAAQRAEYLQEEFLSTLRADRERLRTQCKNAEEALSNVRPRIAELEQAARNAQSQGWQATAAIAIGGGLLSCAGFPAQVPTQFLMLGGGWASLIWGGLCLALTNKFGWPQRKT